MQFTPQSLTDAVKSEAEVWDHLKAALPEITGFAYHRFPVYHPNGLFGYEADIALVTRTAGIFVIECKGCEIHHLDRIEGHQWYMRDWRCEVETPVQQARDQMFALKNWLSSTPGVAESLSFHHAVALPFIRRSEWEEKGFDQTAINGAVLLAEDLTAEALRRWVGRLGSAYPQRLRELEWKRLVSRLRHTPEPTKEPVIPSLRFYKEHPPHAKTLRSMIGGDVSHTYVTATTSLEARRRREGFGMNHQMEKGLVQLAFPKMLRTVMKAKLFTRADERVLLWRAAKEVAKDDPDAARRLKHDVFAWRTAIAWLDERGLDLSRAEDMDTVHRQAVHPQVVELLAELQHAYRQEQSKVDSDKTVFEVRARRFLEKGFRPTDCVVLEGFSRFTPLQEYFIKRCSELGARVFLLFPWRSEQARAFSAIKSVAEEHKHIGPQGRSTNTSSIESPPFDPSLTDLHHLKKSLFADDAKQLRKEDRDDSVSVAAYHHVNQEAAETVEQVIACVDEEGLSPEDIVIVTPQPSDYTPLLLEEAERRGKADYFHIPPRKLLLTPPGRFALTLYEVWNAENARLEMSADHFEAILSSGWLGGPLQRTTGDLEMVRAQIFERCATRLEWFTALDRLQELTDTLSETGRLPASGVDFRSVQRWRHAITQVESMCRALFDGNARTVGEHVQLLLDQLTEISDQTVFESEQEIIIAIKKEMEAMAESGSIEMETAEFGDILNSLLRRREEEDVEEEDDPTRISIRSPAGIDRASKKVVFMIGMDGGRMPGPSLFTWPIYRFDTDAHYDEQRYLCLAAVQAAEEQLHVSYAKVANARRQQPSAFFGEIVRLLDTDLDTEVQASRGLEPPQDAAPSDLGVARRTEYTLDEIAHFKLCPHRYRMERLDDNAGRYKSMWQVRFLAQGFWITKVFEAARGLAQPIGRRAEATEHLLELKTTVRNQVEDAFPGLRPLDWRAVSYRVEVYLQDLIWDDYPTSFPQALGGKDLPRAYSPDVVYQDRALTVQVTIPHVIHHGRFDYPALDIQLNREWLIPGQEADGRGTNSEVWMNVRRSKKDGGADIHIYHTEKDGVHVFSSNYDAVQWWSWAHEAVFYANAPSDVTTPFIRRWQADYERLLGTSENSQRSPLTDVVEDMESGRYPKNPGDHCHYCPLKGECLGLDP